MDILIREVKQLLLNLWRVIAPAAVAALVAALTRLGPDLGTQLADGHWLAALADAREAGAAIVTAVIHAVKSWVHTETGNQGQ